jgi:DNA modification methylase
MIVHNPNNLPTKTIADLLPTQGDLKDLTEANYNKLKNVIERRGFSYPVYVWEDKDQILHLLDGHQRQRVLNREGWNDPIPYLKVPAKDLQEAMARLLEITSQYATITQEGIDEFIGKYELNDADVYEATSFDALAFGKTEVETEVEEDEAPEVSSEPAISKLGEIYQLGKHRVMCGDSTDFGSVSDLLDGQKIDMVYTDPPYGINEKGDRSNRGGLGKGGLAKAKKYDDFIDDSTEYAIKAFEIVKDLNIKRQVWWGANYYCHSLPLSNNWFVWDKRVEDKQHDTQSDCELAWVKSEFSSIRIFRHLWKGMMKGSEHGQGRVHPTQKPIALAQWAFDYFKDVTTVLDLFLGSGSTLIACEQTDRTCYGMELDPKYVDVIRKRYAKFTALDDQLPENWEELTPAINNVKLT